MTEHIYLVQLRDEDVYKIGRTSHIRKRMTQYPNESVFHLICECKNTKAVEKKLIELFKSKFEQKFIYGREYFHGSLSQMKKLIFEQTTDYESSDELREFVDTHLVKTQSKNDVITLHALKKYIENKNLAIDINKQNLTPFLGIPRPIVRIQGKLHKNAFLCWKFDDEFAFFIHGHGIIEK